MVSKAYFTSQASSALAERLFSDLGKMGNNHAHSTLCDSLEMTELIRIYLKNELGTLSLPQRGLNHPEAAQFNRLILRIACEVNNYKSQCLDCW